jgi:hypothetical protein
MHIYSKTFILYFGCCGKVLVGNAHPSIYSYIQKSNRQGVIVVHNLKVSASSREAALEKAISEFESDRGPTLFDPSAVKNDFNVNILRSKIVVEKLQFSRAPDGASAVTQK